jgi:hypothetical protein
MSGVSETRVVEPVILEMPLFYDEGTDSTTAVVFDRETGKWWDECYNLETALGYVHDPAVVVIGVGPQYWRDGDLRFTVAEVEQAIEHEYDLVSDCFGWARPTVSAA